jgi:hypothetical protein
VIGTLRKKVRILLGDHTISTGQQLNKKVALPGGLGNREIFKRTEGENMKFIQTQQAPVAIGPYSQAVEVSRLPRDVLVEIECIAVKSSSFIS